MNPLFRERSTCSAVPSPVRTTTAVIAIRLTALRLSCAAPKHAESAADEVRSARGASAPGLRTATRRLLAQVGQPLSCWCRSLRQDRQIATDRARIIRLRGAWVGASRPTPERPRKEFFRSRRGAWVLVRSRGCGRRHRRSRDFLHRPVPVPPPHTANSRVLH